MTDRFSHLRSWRLPRSLLVTLAAGSVALVATSCGDSTSGPAGASSSTAAVDTGGQAEVGGGDAPGIVFESPRYRYRITSPGAVTQAADGTASGSRGDERLVIRVVTGPAAADPASVARGDLTTAKLATPDFAVQQSPASTTVGGRPAIKDVTVASDGQNPLTGRFERRVTVRYYVPRDASTAAVLTYSIPEVQYDPQAADDIAATFRWLG
ncbi:MAG TPA: hypothetical protein VI316_07140 [Candidatus Dormibacteraeota bacterium]